MRGGGGGGGPWGVNASLREWVKSTTHYRETAMDHKKAKGPNQLGE